MLNTATAKNLDERPPIEIEREAFTAVRQERERLAKLLAQLQLAQNLASQPVPLPERAVAAIAEAGPELHLARSNPRHTAMRIEQTAFELNEYTLAVFAPAKARWDAACHREMTRLVDEYLPLHRAAAKRISKALEALSAALGEEIELREALKHRAPVPSLGVLQSLSDDFIDSNYMPNWSSAASVWHRRLSKEGYLR